MQLRPAGSDVGLSAGEWSKRGPEKLEKHQIASETAALADTAQLSAALYDELCAIARRLWRGEREDHAVQTAALVNESLLR